MTLKTKVRDIRQAGASIPIIEVRNFLFENYDLKRNEVTGTIEVRTANTEDTFEQLNENSVYIRLKIEGYKITMADLMALLNSDFVTTYNPFRDYFDNLPAPVPGTIEKFCDFIHTTSQAQFKQQFKKWTVRTIACALEDRIFNKQCLTMIGADQGSGKTTLCRYLVPSTLADYYTENLTTDKDGQIALAQNFIINLDELSILSRFELNQMKAFFSRDRISVRHPYARKQTTEPRRASFVASTNEDAFLNDFTGSVRWLCFYVHKINWDYKKIPIDFIWSEAYHLYKSGFEYEMSGQELRENEQRNEIFQIVSQELEYIEKFFRPGNKSDIHSFLTTTEIRDRIISKTDIKADLRSLDKVGKALKKLGFERVPKRIDNDRVRYGYYVSEL